MEAHLNSLWEFISNSRIIFGNTLLDYIGALILFLGGTAVLFIIRKYIFSRVESWARKSNYQIDDTIIDSLRSKSGPILIIILLYMSTRGLSMPSGLEKIGKVVLVVLLAVLILRFVLDILLFILRQRMLKDDGESRASAYQALSVLLKIAGWTLALLIVLDNLGVQISGLLTGLGIGGVAIAFAAQAILGDIFSYFSIFLDKPFEVGDFIIVGEYLGVVEKTGIKTTRLRSLSGEELVFSNKDLTASRIRNYKTMNERRVYFKFGIKYETPLEKLEKVEEMVKEIIDTIEQIRVDRVNFHSFGDFALIFEVVYYIELADYNMYRSIQATINLELVRTFRKEGIEFAFPTQEIILSRQSD